MIEMLIVISIIGILAGIIVVGLGTRRGAARDAQRIADIRTIQGALEIYYQANQEYPSVLSNLTPSYITSLPEDSVNDATYYYRYAPSGGATSPDNQAYILGAQLEDETSRSLNNDVDDADVPFTPIFGSCGNAIVPEVPPVYCVTF